MTDQPVLNINQTYTADVTYTKAEVAFVPGNGTTILQGITLANSDTTGASTLTLSTDFLKISAILTAPGLSITGTVNYLPAGATTPIVLATFSINDGTVVVPQTAVDFEPNGANIGAFV